jgi:hypothetical protein
MSTPDASVGAVERLADLTGGVWHRLRARERRTMQMQAQPDRDMDLVPSGALNAERPGCHCEFLRE